MNVADGDYARVEITLDAGTVNVDNISHIALEVEVDAGTASTISRILTNDKVIPPFQCFLPHYKTLFFNTTPAQLGLPPIRVVLA